MAFDGLTGTQDQPVSDWIERWRARMADTKARFGIQLPVVDWVSAAQRTRRGFDEDQLCLCLVKAYAGEMDAIELVVEDLTADGAVVLLAGIRHSLEDPRFIERRLVVGIEEDLMYYTDTWRFWIQSSQAVRNESNVARVWVPRWATRN